MPKKRESNPGALALAEPEEDAPELIEALRAAQDLPPGELETRMLWRPAQTIEIRQAARAEGAEPDEWIQYEFPVSSELPVERWFGSEILGHKAGECRFDRLKDGGSIREGHWGDQIGVCEDAWLEGRRLWVRIRFSKNERAQELERDVKDRIRRNVSIGYVPVEMVLIKEDKAGGKFYRVTDWEVYHVAIVPDSADPTVGIGRSEEAARTYLCRVRGGIPAKEEAMLPEKSREIAPALREPGDGPGGAVAVVTREAPPQKSRSEEITEIRAAAKENGIPDALLLDVLGRELKPEQARNVFWGHRTAQAGAVAAQPGAEKLLSARDAAAYSVPRALRMAANLIRRDGVEWEVSRGLERMRPVEQESHGGIFIPYRIRDLVAGRDELEAQQVRALDAGTKGHGAELLATGVELIDLLRNATVLGPAGATFLSGLTAPIPFAKKTAAVTFSWLGEGKTITPGDIKFIPLELGPKRLGGAIDVSRELLLQANIDVGNMVTTDLNEGPSIALDYGALFGAGGAEPLGLWNLPASSGIQSVAMGGVPTWPKLTSMPGKTAKANGLKGRLGHVTTPELASLLQATPRVSGAAAGFIWEGPLDNGLMNGYPARQSPQMRSNLGGSSDEHAMAFGPWQHVIVGLWGGSEVLVDPYTQSLNNQIRYVLNMVGNSICRYPEAFVKGTGAKLA